MIDDPVILSILNWRATNLIRNSKQSSTKIRFCSEIGCQSYLHLYVYIYILN